MRGTKKRPREEEKPSSTEEPLLVRRSDEPTAKKKWSNKQRVLVFSSRGITHRERHLMQNIRNLLPHSKPDSKMEKKGPLFVINEIAEMKNCNKCIYFENKKKQDLYMWISNVPNGPSAKFLVENIHTMEELKLTGNCLKGSRPLLSFDKTFNSSSHWELLKELLVQIFGVPYHHPRSQPFVDHVFTFSILDNRVWFRNYQIIEEDASLVEIGPRFVLNPIRIFEGSFGGPVLFTNSQFVSPNMHRRLLKLSASGQYQSKVAQKEARSFRKSQEGKTYDLDELDDVFRTNPPKQRPNRNKFKRGNANSSNQRTNRNKITKGSVKVN